MHNVIQETACNLKIFNIKIKYNYIFIISLSVCSFSDASNGSGPQYSSAVRYIC